MLTMMCMHKCVHSRGTPVVDPRGGEYPCECQEVEKMVGAKSEVEDIHRMTWRER